MTINPIAFAQEVNRQFLRYQLTAFPLSDPDMAEQARRMLGSNNGDSQLVKGPYISLSRAFAEGKALGELVQEGKLHRNVASIAEHPRMFAHQQRVLEAVSNGKHVLVSTGTGSGKTEAFLYPILDHCFRLRDQGAKKGIAAIIVYPMNALAYDQLERLRRLLAGTGITFGMYVGSTPQKLTDANVVKMKEGEGKEKIAEYEGRTLNHPDTSIVPFEERVSEEELREDPPRILLTNINQLELLMTRGRDLGMFEDAPLRLMVFDEAHTYTGVRGAEVSVLVRRVRSYCNKRSDEVICIGTSATMVDPSEGDDAPRRFASRFFGVPSEDVTVVKEEYRDHGWGRAMVRPRPLGEDALAVFEEALRAVEGEGNAALVAKVLERLSSHRLDPNEGWRTGLYHALDANEVVRTIYDALSRPMSLVDATKVVWADLGRGEVEEHDVAELLTYLVLGAASEKDGAPLLRPQLHYFVRGLGGTSAVLYDGGGTTKAKLSFSRERAAQANNDVFPNGILPVLTCINCGQHFFSLWMSEVKGNEGLAGGLAEGGNAYWPRVPDEEVGGTKVTITNNFVSEQDDLEGTSDRSEKLDKKREVAHICRYCGTLHLAPSAQCLNPRCVRPGPLLPVYVLKELGDVSSCPSCGHRGRKIGSRVRSPLRELRAVSVADVHILAQDMINARSNDNRKLIVFADNRQDAAFQAAWSADHSRRYRFRHLIYRIVASSNSPVSIGDVQRAIEAQFKEDPDLAKALAPEVYAGQVEEVYSTRTEEDMRRYLRIQLVRELVTTFSQRENLENWGKLRVCYHGVDEGDEAVIDLATRYGVPTDELVHGIEGLLDIYRRSRLLYDQEAPIYSRHWHPGSEEVQRGFLPLMEFPPKGLKLDRGEEEKNVVSVRARRGHTIAQEFVRKWGVEPEQVDSLLEDIWKALVGHWGLIIPVTLLSSKGKGLGTKGVYQIDSSKLGLLAQEQRYVCGTCGRVHSRPTPRMACTTRRCSGRLRAETPPEDDYNVRQLDKDFVMLMPREHTAQVPAGERAFVEREFKRTDGSVNCIMATPTLELGVDIGSLDTVLMRNVPPLPSNYWQRAGRAGRRQRMAVVYTYCRTMSPHDDHFFEDPTRMLGGAIRPPRSNMRNPVMVQKHVHATLLTELVRASGRMDDKAVRTRNALMNALPQFVSDYLFVDGEVRSSLPDVFMLQGSVLENRREVEEAVNKVFSDNWPEDALMEVGPELLSSYVKSTADLLERSVALLHRRMLWAVRTRNELYDKEKRRPKLDEGDIRLLRRCKDYLARLQTHSLDNYTLNYLARDGFLPGYAVGQGNVTAFAGNGYTNKWSRLSFELQRPSSIAVRELAPGNLIYANGGRYRTAWYHLPFEKDRLELESYVVDAKLGLACRQDRSIDGYASDAQQVVPVLPISDVELTFISHVSDEEQNRFRMPVTIVGNLGEEDRGWDHYSVGGRKFVHLHGQKIKLINVGPADRVADGKLGYPICRVCGATRSPYGSDAELKDFAEGHKKSCGQEPSWLALSAESQVDALMFQSLPSMEEAVNLVEGLRTSAGILLEMEADDLQMLLLPKKEDEFDILLYDPMPGGSGLLDQVISRWNDIIDIGVKILGDCRGGCETSCYQCLRSYRNIYYHDILDRQMSVELLKVHEGTPDLYSQTPARTGMEVDKGCSTNAPEMRLAKLLAEKGLNGFERQKCIPLPGSSIRSTTPDFYYEDKVKGTKVAVYLDGLSKGIHGDPSTAMTDDYIRTVLESEGVRVVAISASTLDDPRMLEAKLKLLSRAMQGGL